MSPRLPRLLLTAVALSALAAAGSRAAEPTPKGKPNKLAREVSPYLLQHAHNPVDWHPWGAEAFEKAKKEGKLVFLSIGYSSCHWCHVMERESFSVPAVAEILNANFVCIKVDREERPDVDEVYMTALQQTGVGGGWPLSMFLTPEGKPIFGGTYWPPEDRVIEGQTVQGFKSTLKRVVELNKEKHKELFAQADSIAEMTVKALDRNTTVLPVKLDRELVASAVNSFDMDPVHGGFGLKYRDYKGTKFPRVPALGLLLREGRKDEFSAVGKLVALTLDQMAAGGIYDHIGGGFHRYSTERTWTVPHFEKMLYDNAQLVELYSVAYKLTPKPAHKRVIEETLEFVERELTSPEGAFYSALDADSNGHEGEFYVWTAKEIDDVLGAGDDATLFKLVYGVEKPNFEEKYSILRLSKPLAESAKERKVTEDELLTKLAPMKAKLLAARAKRVRPFRDTKILTGWNGQMIAGYARAGGSLGETKYVRAAEKAADFLLSYMRTKDGRLFRIYAAQPGAKAEARQPAFLEDYAYLTHGLLTLHEVTGDARWLTAAREVTDQMLKWHADEARGGFYITANDAEKLFARGKDSYDGAQPSGNGTAIRNLVRLAALTKDEKYKTAAEKALTIFAPVLKANPHSAPLTAEALSLWLEGR
ncbi:thioredoxin domain-containing protein [Fimbriiglobus ruber]|uniref:Thymidylate kinase n=1 Tax=Fimbriiglobus ruber TaxID=1908690 RepID=A0A225CZA8_9BACT|nr:thioredoxin domain-containing protein [Fimbriiglobus ruber]OWK34681.1 Thymidylate kinase [Fimbriiglobus ruber]